MFALLRRKVKKVKRRVRMKENRKNPLTVFLNFNLSRLVGELEHRTDEDITQQKEQQE